VPSIEWPSGLPGPAARPVASNAEHIFCPLHWPAMPKELRKRGKRHKKPAVEYQTPAREQDTPLNEGPSSGPSWIVPRHDSKQLNPEAPFGYVDPELKAYFRTVDDQLKEWQQNWYDSGGEEDVDPNESTPCFFYRSSSYLGKSVSSTDELANDLSCVDRRMFLMAALQEISGKERELATDPDCAGGLERIAYSMDDFVRRVFMDSLTGS
jgi:nucleolar protein 9